MKRKLLHIVFAISMVVLLRGLISLIIMHTEHANWILKKNLDPSIMFYTESNEVLKAEKEVRNQVHSKN